MKISIITASFNSSKSIKNTLDSVKNQSYTNIEHIIIDGMSNDNTISIVNTFSHVSKVVVEKDNGIYDAINKGIKLATGDIVGILNSDDVFYNNEVISIDYITKKGKDLKRTIEPTGQFSAKTTGNQILVAFDRTIGDIRAFIVSNVSKWAFTGKKFEKKSSYYCSHYFVKYPRCIK